ncbi:MAG TPA: GNAT family N-acetyltransferase [Devosiaceae bacterium]|nr:GNAT family N-acetyltransferase [Devosiaceae bacterium]
MVESATLEAPLARAVAADLPVDAAVRGTGLAISVSTTSRIEEAEAVWRRLEASGIESPGQSFDFVRQWIAARQIPAAEQLFATVSLAGQPVALLPLWRQRRAGVRVYGWFPGAHVGCGAPLVDAARLSALTPAQRAAFWRQALGGLKGADLIHLEAVPERAGGAEGLFSGLGRALPTETLYRAAFSSWDEANTTQRSKSRRKHDRQQGERLEALGKVEFEAIGNGPDALPVLEEMFRQRTRRFEAMGIADPFAPADIARFYRETVAADSGVKVMLHVLRLDGAIVAVRYNIVFGDRLFCLISSMSDEPRIQGGSPGKQCLLRVMQTVFDAGFRVFDMGNGFTDEKRHWCNERIPVASHYVPLTFKGRLLIEMDAQWRALKARVKSNPRLLAFAKAARSRLRGGRPAAETAAATDEQE